MAAVDHLASAHADEEVLGVVRHSDHLVRYDLARRDDEVIRGIHDTAVDLDGERGLPQAFGNVRNNFGGDVAEFHHVGAPVVDDHPVERHIAEHGLPLRLGDGDVCAEGRHDVDLDTALVQRMPEGVCDEAGVGVEAREIGREDEDAPERAPFQRLREGRADFIG